MSHLLSQPRAQFKEHGTHLHNMERATQATVETCSRALILDGDIPLNNSRGALPSDITLDMFRIFIPEESGLK